MNDFDFGMAFTIRSSNKMIGNIAIHPVIQDSIPFSLITKQVSDIGYSFSVRPHNVLKGIIEIVPKPTITVIFNPNKDAYVRESFPLFNYGDRGDLYVGYSSYLEEVYRSFLGFDISSIPSNQNIKNAKLRIYVDTLSSPLDIDLYESNQDWTENGITWSNQPTSMNHLSSLRIDRSGEYVEIDATEQVSKWHKREDYNGGFSLKTRDESDGFVRLLAREGSKKPELVVEYYDPIVRSVGENQLPFNMVVVGNSEKVLGFNFTVASTRTEADMPFSFKLTNGLPFSFFVTRDQIGFSATIVQGKHGEMALDFSVRQSRVDSIPLSFFVGRNEIPFSFFTRQVGEEETPFSFTIRHTKEENVPFDFFVGHPQIGFTLTAKQADSIGFDFKVMSYKDLPFGMRIVHKKEQEIPFSFKNTISDELGFNFFVSSGWLGIDFKLSYQDERDLPMKFIVRQVGMEDMAFLFEVRSRRSYGFIM